jgi:hypothetical protein
LMPFVATLFILVVGFIYINVDFLRKEFDTPQSFFYLTRMTMWKYRNCFFFLAISVLSYT